MTEKELNHIKAESFDRGWRIGLAVGIGIISIAGAIVLRLA